MQKNDFVLTGQFRIASIQPFELLENFKFLKAGV